MYTQITLVGKGAFILTIALAVLLYSSDSSAQGFFGWEEGDEPPMEEIVVSVRP